MKKIITLTLSPAFDLHCKCDGLALYEENLAHVTSLDAGGKGINIARALTANSTPCIALTVLGEDNCDAFEKQLCREEISYKAIRRPGRVRENVTIHTQGKAETRISFSGFSADESVLEEFETEILSYVGENGSFYLTLTGRVPDGIPMAAVHAFLLRMKPRGAAIIIDSKSFTKDDILTVRPWLIKPNEDEITLYADAPIHTSEDAARTICDLHRQGIEHVLLTQGEKGALLATSEGVLKASVPQIRVLSTVGAGDSSIAGFLSAHQKGLPLADCLSTALAFGSAACLRDGTAPPLPEDIENIKKEINVDVF